MEMRANRTQLEQEEAVRDYIARLTLMDDLFMAAMFEDRRCIQTVLRVVMDKPDLEVIDSWVRQDLINLAGRSAQVDVLAIDGEGTHYDIEVQRSPAGSKPRRARYYGAILDAKALERGGRYQDLPETYVIFITETDVLHGGLPIYHIGRCIWETGGPYDDGLHVIYVNGAFEDDGSPLGDLAHDFRCAEPGQMRYNVLRERSGRLKGGGEEVVMMSESIDRLIAEFKDRWIAEGLEEGREKGFELGVQEGIEKGIEKGIEQGIEQGIEKGIEQGIKQGIDQGIEQGVAMGRLEGARDVAVRMLAQGLSPDQVSACTLVPLDEVEKLALEER